MKKLILCSLIAISVAFGVDCNAMVKRYANANKPMMLFESCTDNNNADACLCGSAITMSFSEELQKSGNYNEANKYEAYSIKLAKRACQLGNREACAILDEAGMGLK